MVTYEEIKNKTTSVAVVGLGYVGLPLAAAFSRHFDVIGFDVNAKRIKELQEGFDRTNEVEADVLKNSPVRYTASEEMLAEAGIVVVAVPTPIDEYRTPDLRPVRSASITVGRNLKPGCVVVFESTVYPGLTEEECVPLLEENSGLICGKDFWVGYSPERINPGDKEHTLETIVKIVAGQDEATALLLDKLYSTVVKAGTHRAPTIKVAEAAKVIENTQRDLNIALMNELAMIFDRVGIDTLDVLQAAGTKWNFLNFRPGLVGGHCIGVDPYYLTYKAQALGFHPEIILAGRRINDNMAKYVSEKVIKQLFKHGCRNQESRVGILGLTFKENVPDLRNTKVIDLVRDLQESGVHVLVHDAEADPEEAQEEYGLDLVRYEELVDLDGLILCVGHDAYTKLSPQGLLRLFRDKEKAFIWDIKGFFDPKSIRNAGIEYTRL